MKLIIILLTLLCSFQGYTQKIDTISINTTAKKINHLHQIYTPSALIVVGILADINFGKSLDAKLYKARNTNIPHFNTKLDDYLQYSPILLAYGFDALGIFVPPGFQSHPQSLCC